MNDEYGDELAPQEPSQQEVNAFVASARFSDTAAVTAFLDKYPAFIDRKSCFPRPKNSLPATHTALTKAATHGQKDMVALLLKKGAQIEALGDNNKTALLWAAHNGHTETVRLLLDNKADITASYNEGLTPLIITAWHGHTKVVELLLEKGAQIDETCKSGATPLILAAAFGETDTVRFLLEKGATIDKADNIGRTALTMPRSEKNAEAVALLEQWPEMQRQRKEEERWRAEELAEGRVKARFNARLEKLKAKRPPPSPFKKKM